MLAVLRGFGCRSASSIWRPMPDGHAFRKTQTGGFVKTVGWTFVVSCFLAGGAKATTGAHNASRSGVQYGVASWYGEEFQGRKMASGERFNEYSMIAAHRTLPLGSRVEVTNLSNGLSVVVRVMDRGPYIAGRAIDLSKAAANRLAFTSRGLARVRIRVLSLHPAGQPLPAAHASLIRPTERKNAPPAEREDRTRRALVASR